jgi:hypothetical protein
MGNIMNLVGMVCTDLSYMYDLVMGQENKEEKEEGQR